MKVSRNYIPAIIFKFLNNNRLELLIGLIAFPSHKIKEFYIDLQKWYPEKNNFLSSANDVRKKQENWLVNRGHWDLVQEQAGENDSNGQFLESENILLFIEQLFDFLLF